MAYEMLLGAAVQHMNCALLYVLLITQCTNNMVDNADYICAVYADRLYMCFMHGLWFSICGCHNGQGQHHTWWGSVGILQGNHVVACRGVVPVGVWVRNVFVVELIWGCCSPALHVSIWQAPVGELDEAHDVTAFLALRSGHLMSWAVQLHASRVDWLFFVMLSAAVMPYFWSCTNTLVNLTNHHMQAAGLLSLEPQCMVGQTDNLLISISSVAFVQHQLLVLT